MDSSISKLDTQLLNDLIDSLACQIPDVIWICTEDYTKQLYLSKSFEEIYNLPCDVLYKNLGIFATTILQEDITRTATNFYARMFSQNYSPINFRIHRPDGEIRFIQDIHFDLYDKEGKKIAACGIGKSLTELEWEYSIAHENKPLESQIKKLTDFQTVITQNLKLETRNQMITSPLNDSSNLYRIIIENREIILTKTQAACLVHLLRGGSSKVIARELQSSHRTVETHIAHIKNKAGYNRIIELISKINNKDEIAKWTFTK